MESLSLPEVGKLHFVPAQPDTGDDTTARQRVQARQLLRQDDRVPLWHHDNRGPQAQPGMTAADVGKAHDGLVDDAVLALGRVGHQHMVGGPDGRPPQALGCLGGSLDTLGAGTLWHGR